MRLPSLSMSFRGIEDQRLVQAMRPQMKEIRLVQLQGEECLQEEEALLEEAAHREEEHLVEAWVEEAHLDSSLKCLNSHLLLQSQSNPK